MKEKILYGTTTKGAIKQWSVATDGDEIIVRHGQHGGVITEKRTKALGKNIGRANETTPSEQAEREALAKWTKQKDKSYCEDINDIQPMLNPMLAYDYYGKVSSLKYPCNSQPKLDGVRALVYLTDPEDVATLVIMSRGGKQYPIPNHLRKQLEPFFEQYKSAKLDGELYIHGQPLNKISSATKKLNALSKKLEFWVFDNALENTTWEQRRLGLKVMSSLYTNTHLKFLSYNEIRSEEELMDMHDRYKDIGYEGLMARNLEGMYSFDHRSSDLLKVKKFIDAEYEVVSLYSSKDGLGMFTCNAPESTDPKDKTFGVTPAWTHEERKAMLLTPEKFIGKMLTVKYQAMTKYNKPQFGTGVNIRGEGE